MKSFTEVLCAIRRGLVVDVASEKLAEVIKAVEATGLKGSLTVKLSFEKHESGAIITTSKIEAKAPDAPMPDAIFFADDDGTLHREDPRQKRLDLEGTVRQING